MTINFTGIKDIHVYEKEHSEHGLYPDYKGNIKLGQKKYNEYMFVARLTDDKDGNHLSDYLKSLPKGYENAKGKDLVKIHTIEMRPVLDEDDALAECDNAKDICKISAIILNDKKLNTFNTPAMATLTQLARIVHVDADKTDMSPLQKEYADKIDNVIYEKAVEYLNN